MPSIDALILFTLLATTILAVVHALASRAQRHQVKHAIRRAFPVSTTAFRGQVCTSTGTAFSVLTNSMVVYPRD